MLPRGTFSSVEKEDETCGLTASDSDNSYKLFRKFRQEEMKDTTVTILIDCPWNKIVQCRLPFLGQPWMLQRAKWESFTFDADDIMGIVDMEHIGTGPITAWKMTHCSSEATIHPQELRMSDKSTAFSVGGVCGRTGYVKALLRQYSKQDQSLQSVAWLEGRLMVKDEII